MCSHSVIHASLDTGYRERKKSARIPYLSSWLLHDITPLLSKVAGDTTEVDGIRNRGLNIVLFNDIKITNWTTINNTIRWEELR